MRSRHVHDPDFSAKRGCVWAPGLILLLLVMIITGVLVGCIAGPITWCHRRRRLRRLYRQLSLAGHPLDKLPNANIFYDSDDVHPHRKTVGRSHRRCE